MHTDSSVITFIVQLIIVVGSFLLGRYVLPKYGDKIQNEILKYSQNFSMLLSYAESFCSYARQFLDGLSGEEKMDSVVAKLEEICDTLGINVDRDTLRAIGQKAYDNMINGTITIQTLEPLVDVVHIPTEETTTEETKSSDTKKTKKSK